MSYTNVRIRRRNNELLITNLTPRTQHWITWVTNRTYFLSAAPLIDASYESKNGRLVSITWAQ